MLAFLDSVILLVAIYLGLFMRWADVSRPLAAIQGHFSHALIFAAVISITMFSVGLYQRQVWQDWATIFARLVVSFALAFLFLSLIFYMFPDTAIWRSATVIAVGAAMLACLALRILYFRLTDLEAFKRRILVLGAGDTAARVARLDSDRKSKGFFVCVGFIQVNGSEQQVPRTRLITGVNDLAEYVQRESIEEVVVAVDDRRGSLPVQALLDCKLSGVAVTDFMTFYERETGRIDLGGLRPSWFIFSQAQAGQRGYETAKRFFDAAACLVFTAFVLPLLVAVAIAIRVDSPGPILYRQERTGLRGRTFSLLKFRTMITEAEADGMPQWAGEQDPRVTRVGRFLRRTRIDELPQLLNVLRGDMSLVGPRPERPFFVDSLCRDIPFYSERHCMKPGLTGWAQINYRYSDSVEDAKTKTEFDLYYIKNHSMFLDFIIVLQTLRVVIWPEGVR